MLADLYPIIAEVSESTLIVDSSKHPAWAYLLAGTAGIDLRVVHLVRHPSAVVHSWSRSVRRPHSVIGTGDEVMAAQSPVEVGVRWDLFNLLYGHLARKGVPTEVIRYEDYVDDVDGALRTCMALSGRPYRPASGLAVGHGIAGNPSRFAVEGATVERDDRWLLQMGAARHLLVSGLDLAGAVDVRLPVLPDRTGGTAPDGHPPTHASDLAAPLLPVGDRQVAWRSRSVA